MKFVIQRVKEASVKVDDEYTGKIKKGYLVLIGVGQEDTKEEADKYIRKMINLRIFEDENGKTNCSLKDVDGELLLVSQFTLYASCRKGNRPSFTQAGDPKKAEELYEYIKKARYEAVQLKGMREYAIREQLEGLYTVHDEKYGYILSDDRRELLIDEEAAVVVREIFQMVLDGMLLTNIVKILNDSEIESPMVHNARVGHKVWPVYDNKWLFCSVRRILRCTAYAGYWQKTINKKICTLPIAPILEEGIFEKVQEILDKRKKPRKVRTGKRGLFVKKIFDAETGRKISQRNFKTGETVFLFASGTNQLPRDKSTYISFETVIAEVRKAIQREMELAEQIKKKLSAREAESEKYKWLKQYSQRAWAIFEEMEQVEKERIPLYQNYQTGKINEEEYLAGKEEIRDQLRMYDGDFSELMEAVSVIEKTYSNKNEWLGTFKKENLPKELQPEHINKWIEKVLIRDFKEVQVCLSKQEWKKYFPAEWMEE